MVAWGNQCEYVYVGGSTFSAFSGCLGTDQVSSFPDGLHERLRWELFAALGVGKSM